MDLLGFSLENFDALGKWRTTSDGAPIAASATLPDGSRFEGVAGLRTLLMDHREDFVRTFTERLLSYSIGRGTEASDWPAVRKIVRDTASNDYCWSSIILAIVRSTPFAMSGRAGLQAGRGAASRAGRAETSQSGSNDMIITRKAIPRRTVLRGLGPRWRCRSSTDDSGADGAARTAAAPINRFGVM